VKHSCWKCIEVY